MTVAEYFLALCALLAVYFLLRPIQRFFESFFYALFTGDRRPPPKIVRAKVIDLNEKQ